MFNFHKPRTYRSAEGCCICRAKSSSSRFADSRKYERDTMLCFDLKFPRQGEICNACVLLVKRFKRLPVGSKRNWAHIVDAKAGIGPGYNKIQTKYKSERINSKAAALQNENPTNSIAAVNNGGSATVSGSASTSSALTFVPEKFSKILKKTRKFKESSSQNNSRRKAANNGWSQNNTISLPTTPDSLDSDYEDSRANASLSGNMCTSSVVQFQTQTRASAYKAQAAAEARMKIAKMGSKRRKNLPPRKNYRFRMNEEALPFFDDEEWCKRTLCCGMLYECAALGGAVLIDTANFKTCEQHQQPRLECRGKHAQPGDKPTNLNDNLKKSSTLPLAKSIIQTMPAVVQLQPSQSALPFSSPLPSSTHLTTSNNTFTKTSTTSSATPTPTPVLKKHHLFYKRQSECFPQGDIVTTSTNKNIDIGAHSAKHIKTESNHHHNQQQRQQNNINLQRHIIENAIHSSSQTNPSATVLTDSLSTLALSVSVTSLSSATIPTMPQMPKHSLAKVTTISPPLTSSVQQLHHPYNFSSSNNSGSCTLPLAKPNSTLHKVKSDSGKIVKHSLDKFNTAVRLKSSDIINEIKPMIRTVDKSYIMSKPPTQSNNVSLNAPNTATANNYQTLTSYNAVGPASITTTSLSAASPTSSTSSTSSTKFSDNSSDSGFDENMLDRKSASPLQEDCEKKILSRPGVHTMFLASGVQIQSQQQNLVLAGNEVAAKILQNRKYSTMTTSSIPPHSRALSSNHNPTTTAVKIAQISTNSLISQPSSSTANCAGPQLSMSSAAQAKMRAIYSNNNTIQHENGITTIVPASSLAATTQTAAMQNIAPSTVTITPAPPGGTQFNPQNVISRKLTTANIINLQSNTNNLSNSHNNASGNHYHHHLNSSINSSGSSSSSSSSSNNNMHNNMTNQKIILLKTSPNNTTTVTAAGSYNSLAGGGGGQMGNCGGGR